MEAGRFDGYPAFVAAVRQTVIRACEDGVREMFWLDASFVDWPLSDPALLAALSAWASRPRCLHLLALDYEALRQRHPRFAQWRATYGHCVLARAIDPDLGTGFASGTHVSLIAGATTVRMLDATAWRGVLSFETADALRTHEKFDAMAQRSCESFAARTLGL